MTFTLDASTQTAIAEDITQPYFLVEMDFDPPNAPIRYSTVGQISWDSKTWLAAGIEVQISDRPSLTVFNEDTTFGQVVLTYGTSGKGVVIYQGYRNDSAHPNPVMVFNGEMGEASISSEVQIQCKRTAPLRTPRHYCVAPTFNHMPPAGTKFETPKGTITLEES